MHVQQKGILFMGDGPSFFSKKRRFPKISTFWFSELEDARDTRCSGRQSSKDKVSMQKSEIHTLHTECNPYRTQNPNEVRATTAEPQLPLLKFGPKN
jgi:hypothetical protein